MNKIHQKFVVPKNKHFNNPIFTDNKINTENSEESKVDDEITIKSIDFNSSEKSATPGIKYVDDEITIETEESKYVDDEITIKSIKSIDFNSSEKSATPGIKYVDDEIIIKSIESIEFNSPEKSAIIDDIKKILEKYKEFISSNSIENIREDLAEYKKITDQRIEKLVNLFLSIR